MSRLLEKITQQIDLVESVKNALFDAILTGEFLPGEKLAQDDLAEQMGVSRQPIIQALRILSDHGILSPYGKKGVAVSELDEHKLLSLLQVRNELDCLAAKLAAMRAKTNKFDEDDHNQINDLHELIDRSLTLMKGNNIPETHADLIRNDIEFHKMIRSLSGNMFIQTTLEPHLLHFSRVFYVITADRHHVIWDQHNSILEAILGGNVETAQNLTKAHSVEAETLIHWYREKVY